MELNVTKTNQGDKVKLHTPTIIKKEVGEAEISTLAERLYSNAKMVCAEKYNELDFKLEHLAEQAYKLWGQGQKLAGMKKVLLARKILDDAGIPQASPIVAIVVYAQY